MRGRGRGREGEGDRGRQRETAGERGRERETERYSLTVGFREPRRVLGEPQNVFWEP